MAQDYPKPTGALQRIVLASSSPRRARLLKLITERFEQVPPRVDEGDPKTPEDLLLAARAKAQAVGERVEKAIVIAADTGVFVSGRHLGKPRDLDEARRMLAALSGRKHTVATGVCVLSRTGMEEELVSTRVKFFPLTPEEIDWYLGSEGVLDKAGAYGIQGRAAAFVEGIEGDFYNVMGLPVSTVYRLLKRAGWRPEAP
ncbi:TPA: septum formation protein Maf [Candidatus Acetothermia bacterium]|nr:septum formation protein Maf [Candidatus Acetothermia bacterium]